jgi:glucose-6-phosphate 1-dehydrogenase
MVTQNPTPAGSAAPLDLVIFGGVGDLSVRKLLPALYMAHLHNNLPAATRIHALGRQAWDRAAFVAFLQEKVPGFIEEKAFADDTWAGFLERITYVSVDATKAEDFATLAGSMQSGSDRVYYLATAPSLFVGICANLSGAGLIDARSRVVLEKPLGHDLASARQINDDVGQHFQEQQIFRIDHYLGKETVQNLMVLRFGNTIFEPLWAAHIQACRSRSPVGRWQPRQLYDGTGAMRDMVQTTCCGCVHRGRGPWSG